MSNRKKKKQAKPEVRKQVDYYKLNTKAIEDLATADESNSPEVSKEELRKYTSAGRFKVANWVKMLIIKMYFPGAVCFFFMWGLGGFLQDQLDLLVVTGTALGIVTDLLTNNIIRFFEKVPGENARWMLFPSKKYYTFIANLLYGYVVLFVVYQIYNGVNTVLVALTGAVDTVPLGVEPILFGVFCCGVDLAFIQIKHALLRLFDRGNRQPRKTR